MTALRVALSLLAKREYARAELAQKLSGRFSPEQVQLALDELQQRGMQSDIRYARAYLRTAGVKFGRAKLIQTLQSKGVSEVDIETAMSDEVKEDEPTRIRKILKTKYPTLKKNAKAQTQAARFLQSRGFGEEDIARVLDIHQEAGEEFEEDA